MPQNTISTIFLCLLFRDGKTNRDETRVLTLSDLQLKVLLNDLKKIQSTMAEI
jgi:hypothetical protein